MDYLAEEQFDLVAITDHDRPDTAGTLQKLAQDKHQPVLVRVEMTTLWQDEMTDLRRDELSGLHEMTDLLCFGFDPDRHALNNLAQDLWHRQRENTREVYENLLPEMYREYAQRHNLLISVGSDSHRPDKPPIKYRAELSRTLLEQVGIQIE